MNNTDLLRRANELFVEGKIDREGYNVLIHRAVQESIREWMLVIDLRGSTDEPIGMLESEGGGSEISTLRDFLDLPQYYGEEAETVPASLSFEAYSRLQEKIYRKFGPSFDSDSTEEE